MKESEITGENYAQNLSEAERVLSVLGKSFADFEPKYNCSICHDTGYVNDKKCVEIR